MNKILFFAISFGMMLTACSSNQPVTVANADAVSKVGADNSHLGEVKMRFSENNVKGSTTVIHNKKKVATSNK